jgi:hypothetical protein
VSANTSSSDAQVVTFGSETEPIGYRILVCGSRDWDSPYAIWCVLNGYESDDIGMTVITGGARGADQHAREWAEHNSVDCETYPADWKKYGKAAGPIRNSIMLAEAKPDYVWAFVTKPLEESRGTNDMVTRARAADINTYVVRAWLPTEQESANLRAAARTAK